MLKNLLNIFPSPRHSPIEIPLCLFPVWPVGQKHLDTGVFCLRPGELAIETLRWAKLVLIKRDV